LTNYKKLSIRRFRKFYSNDGSVTGYTHNNKIGSVAVLEKEDNSLGKDICMQIVASNPLALDETSIDQATLASEKEIYKSELDKLDKKEDIKRNILEGKMKKFIVENTLLDQPFIKDSTLSLRKILKDNAIKSFLRYQLGEGLEKKSDDFAKEVYSQIK